MVSIIILTYNSEKFIEETIGSLLDFTTGTEIIVVDNASTDKTVSKIKKFGKKVKFIETGANLGFSAGINVGAKKATGEYLLFVNPDTKFKSGNIEDMISVFDNNIDAGVVGGRMQAADGHVEKSTGKFFGVLASILIAAGLDEKLGVRRSPGKIEKVDFVSGGFMMVKAELFRKLGGFDENLFMYVEDMELCFRARLSGYSTYFVPSVVVTHIGQGSSNRAFAIKNIFRGVLYFHKKHGTPFSYGIVKALFTLKSLTLVTAGKIMNNKYLLETYSGAVKT